MNDDEKKFFRREVEKPADIATELKEIIEFSIVFMLFALSIYMIVCAFEYPPDLKTLYYILGGSTLLFISFICFLHLIFCSSDDFSYTLTINHNRLICDLSGQHICFKIPCKFKVNGLSVELKKGKKHALLTVEDEKHKNELLEFLKSAGCSEKT